MIYLDNAATTMYKPQAVIDAVTQAMCSLGNAGRGATSGALDAARTIHGCRAKLAHLLGCPRAAATAWSQRCSSTTPCCVRSTAWR